MSYFRLPDTSKPRLLRFPLWASMWLVALFTCADCGISASGEKPAQELAKFALRDYLGREWQNELVFFKVDAALVGRKDAVLMDANGREIPYQWSTEDNGSIAFLASVPKFTRVEYKLVRGTPKTAPNLKVTQQPDSVEMVNDKTGIRVYRNSEALQRGPIAGVKLSSGKWVGSGQLTWPGPPMDFKTTVLTDGPLFADVESAYTSSTGDFWKLRFRIIAGEPVILVDEEFSGAAQAYYQFNAVKDFGPDSLLWRTGPTATTNLWKNLTGEHAFTLEPWLRWGSPMHGTWLAFYRDDSPDLLTIGARDPSNWVEPGKTTWKYAIDVRNDQTMRFQLRGFKRNWMVIALSKKDALQTQSDSAPLSQQYVIKHSDLPLNRVKDFVLEWSGQVEHPRLLATKSEIQEFKANFKVDTKRLNALRRNDPNVALLDDYIAYALATEDAEFKRRLARFALIQLQSAVDLYVRETKFPTQGSDPPRHYDQVTVAVNAIDAVLRPDVLSPAELQLARSQLAFLAYTLANPSVLSPERGFNANPNMTTTTRCLLGMIACLIPEHPKAKDWAELGIREMAKELEKWTGPNGGWLEAPHYMTVSMDAIIPFAIALRQTTFADQDWTLHPKLRDAIRWLASISTPPDPRLAGQRHMPEIGNTYLGERTCLAGWLARLWKEKDPEFAKQMQWAWKEQGFFRQPGIGGAYPSATGYSWLMFDYSIPAQPPHWQSEWFPECGVVMHAHFPSDCETYLYLIAGKLHDHYDYDEGSFILWGKGKPLCEDFGYYGRAPASDHNRVDRAKQDKGAAEIKETANGAQADYLRSDLAGWQRQILFVKDQDCSGPNYFVVRDTLNNDDPADWRLWLATDVPPSTNSSEPIRVQGRFGVDLVVYFLETSDGALSAEALTRKNGASGFKDRMANQRSLHLKLKPHSTVIAVLYPILHGQPTPRFTRLANGAGVKIESSFGTDYAFLGLDPFEFKQDLVAFRGRSGAIQVRPAGAQMTLTTEGEMQFQNHTLVNEGNKVKTDRTGS